MPPGHLVSQAVEASGCIAWTFHKLRAVWVRVSGCRVSGLEFKVQVILLALQKPGLEIPWGPMPHGVWRSGFRVAPPYGDVN